MKVQKINQTIADATEVADILDKAGVDYNPIANVNWEKEFPYKPDVKFRIAYTDNSILIDYVVDEKSVRAVAQKDGDNIWEDSCCEFFFKPEGSKDYYNVECNCAGTLLVAKGPDRNNRTWFAPEEMAKIKRYASLGREPFEEKDSNEPWHLSLIIPLSIYGIKSLDGTTGMANFYKCGDNLTTPHFLSWAPINVPTPNFHLPEFFQKLEF